MPADLMLIAYDGSDNAKRAIEYAGRFLSAERAVVMTAWEPMVRQAARMSGLSGVMQPEWVPDAESEELAQKLGAKLGRSVRADAVRQQLRRARVRFAELLLEEVADGLDQATPDRIEDELISLGLFEHVRDLLPADWKAKRK